MSFEVNGTVIGLDNEGFLRCPLFPYGYGQQACKIAGMRKPLKLMRDI